MENKFIDYINIEEEKELVLKTITGDSIRGSKVMPEYVNYKDSKDGKVNWYGYIYISILPNGKAYVGKHKSDSVDKKYKGSGSVYKKAESKYGKDNVETYIIDCIELPDGISHEEIKRGSKIDKELSKELTGLESEYIKHRFGVDIESPIHWEFYNMPTGFTLVNMKKEVEDYESKLNQVFEGNRDYIREYTRINLTLNKKDTLKLLSKQEYLSEEELKSKGAKHVFTEDQVFNLMTQHFNELPCLYETMYHSFINEVNDLNIETIEDYIDEDRWEPFTKYIMKYLVQENTKVKIVEKTVIHDNITEEMYNEVKKRLKDLSYYAKSRVSPDDSVVEAIEQGKSYLSDAGTVYGVKDSDYIELY